MGSAESRPREKARLVVLVRDSSACSRASGNGRSSSSGCKNKRRQHRSRSEVEKNSAQCCPCQPTYCLPYPEFTPSTSGVCYIQCDFCCEMYPCSCAVCPNCGGRQPKRSVDEAEIPDIAFCPCCLQESPKANGLQNLCKPKPGCMCQCTSAEPEQIVNNKQTHGKQRKRCCQCQKNKSEQFRYPSFQPALLCTCASDTSAAPSSQPQRAEDFRCERNHTRTSSRPPRAEDCCCGRSKKSGHQCESNSRANHKQMQQKQGQGTRAQCCKCERQRSVESCACSIGRGQGLRYGSNPRCPCGCEIEVRNITYDLPVCGLDNGDDDDGCCRCNK